ncbi:hypothetical protein ANCCAN_21324, partial [Ancylostoma caninum]
MDLAIECGLGDVNKRVEASFYDPAHDQVTVVLRSSYRNWTICTFSMSEVEERFDRDWNTCQQATFHDGALVGWLFTSLPIVQQAYAIIIIYYKLSLSNLGLSTPSFQDLNELLSVTRTA